MTTGDWLTHWLDLRRYEIRQRTLDSYTDIVTRYIVPTFGGIELDELAPGDVLALLAAITAEGHTRTAELTYVILRAALAEVRPDLMRRVPRPVHIQRTPEPWTDEQTAVYLQALVGHKHALPLLLAILCGLRRGEICGLRWQDVDLRDRTLTICNQRQRLADGTLIDCPPKSRAGQRIIPYPDALQPLVKAKMQLHGYVCALTPQGLDKAHRMLVRRLGLPRIPLHGLRHTMATACVRHGGDMRSLQLLLGHANYSTTANRYTHPDITMLRGVLARAEDLCYTDFAGTGSLTLNQGVQGSSP